MYKFKSFKIKYFVSFLLLLSTLIGSSLLLGNNSWLEKSISYFGTQPESQNFFNIGVIITGISLIVMVLELFKAFDFLYKTNRISIIKLNALRTIFILFGVFILNVGLFPVDTFRLIHDVSTHTFTLIFIILFFSISLLIPVNKSFSLNSLVVGILSLLIMTLFLLRSITFPGMTLLFFGIFFSWIFQFGYELKNLTKDEQKS